ncbi:MAG TPA: type II toxin-antitoxin system VapC family toxin [Acidobacteriota bacterium]|nr:type II toxin-antitoxin system VapC family toxin [Acidobacteriota bacterium]
MKLLDANLLIYAVDSDSPHHQAAKQWLESALSGTEPIGLPWVVILAFLRITTHPRVMRRPLQAEEALEYVDSWLKQPFVEAVAPGPGHWQVLRNLIRTTGTSGNLTSDAHIAALALEHGHEVSSADNDFKRFPGILHVNPLQPVQP